jgi:hypothetical protein
MKRSHHFGLGILVIGCLIWFKACSVEYSADALSGQVVDSETGKALPGVIVVAHWQLEGGLEGGNRLGAVTAMEAQTDGNGKFSFPPWGPKRVFTSPGINANARIKDSAPELFFFKHGYDYERRLNQTGGGEASPEHMRSEWNGKVIPLKPFHGTWQKYADTIRWLSTSLEGATVKFPETCSHGRPCPAACQWEHIPNTIDALRKEQKLLASQGLDQSTIFDRLVDSDEMYRAAGCASPVAVLKGRTR